MTALMLSAALLALSNGDDCKTCGNENFGTSIVWEGSPSEAAARALKEEKLVFVLHVSGHFEDPRFT